jgi:hypothetical protein
MKIHTFHVQGGIRVSGVQNSMQLYFIWCILPESTNVFFLKEASSEELKNAIDRCKELVLSAEELSIERKWLVHHLVELKFRLSEIQDVQDESQSATTFRVVLGHHFVAGRISNLPRTKTYCDHCCGIIWSVVQASFVCAGKRLVFKKCPLLN